MKKLGVVIIALILIFTLFLFFYFKKTNYEIEYNVDKVNIKEVYNKEANNYLFVFNYKNQDYAFLTKDKYSNKRKLIKKIDIEENETTTCLKIKSDTIKTFTVCRDLNEQISSKMEVPKEKETYNYANITYYDLNQKKYLLWNYHNFIYLNNKSSKEIKILDKDEYNLNLVTTYKNYLVVANKDSSYTFNKIYLINSENGKLEEINLRYDLYYNDTYFLGSYKNNLYLYDKKQEQEYYLNMKKGKIYKTNNKVLINNKWEDISTYKLKNNEGVFKSLNGDNYQLINNKLYATFANYQIRVSDLDVKAIIKSDEVNVYFLSANTLYYYNPYTGIKKLMSYPEWDFNYQNMIYIFD